MLEEFSFGDAITKRPDEFVTAVASGVDAVASNKVTVIPGKGWQELVPPVCTRPRKEAALAGRQTPAKNALPINNARAVELGKILIGSSCSLIACEERV